MAKQVLHFNGRNKHENREKYSKTSTKFSRHPKDLGSYGSSNLCKGEVQESSKVETAQHCLVDNIDFDSWEFEAFWMVEWKMEVAASIKCQSIKKLYLFGYFRYMTRKSRLAVIMGILSFFSFATKIYVFIKRVRIERICRISWNSTNVWDDEEVYNVEIRNFAQLFKFVVNDGI